MVVVAPDREQSAVSHALTIGRPLRADEVRPGWFAVDGTPTDCINLALNGLLTERPWLVVSGINLGANLGDDVTYSGTVSAAMESVLLGVPAIAFSQLGRVAFDFDAAADFARALVVKLRERPLPPDTLLNVNVPEGARPSGYVVTRLGKRRYGDAIVEKTDPRGRKYYWIGGDELAFSGCHGVTSLWWPSCRWPSHNGHSQVSFSSSGSPSGHGHGQSQSKSAPHSSQVCECGARPRPLAGGKPSAM